MSGFEVLREIKQANEQAQAAEYDRLSAALTERREGIELDDWRALPDAD